MIGAFLVIANPGCSFPVLAGDFVTLGLTLYLTEGLTTFRTELFRLGFGFLMSLLSRGGMCCRLFLRLSCTLHPLVDGGKGNTQSLCAFLLCAVGVICKPFENIILSFIGGIESFVEPVTVFVLRSAVSLSFFDCKLLPVLTLLQ